MKKILKNLMNKIQNKEIQHVLSFLLFYDGLGAVPNPHIDI